MTETKRKRVQNGMTAGFGPGDAVPPDHRNGHVLGWFLAGLAVGLGAALAVRGSQRLLDTWRRREPPTRRALATPPGMSPEEALRRGMVYELLQALGFAGSQRQIRWLDILLRPLAGFGAGLAVWFDGQVAEYGIGQAFATLMTGFVDGVQVQGAEHVPVEGPLLLLSNHPGAYDAPLIAANLPRQDLKIVLSTVPLLEFLPHFEAHLIQITREPQHGMRGVREAIRHLSAGGALLTLPSGVVDPDPDVLPGASEALELWSASTAFLLRKVPETQVVLAIVSGVLDPHWLESPVVQLQREPWRQRKLAEFLQVILQALWFRRQRVRPRISFAPPVTAAQWAKGGDVDLQQELIQRAQDLLATHMASSWVGRPGRP